MELLFQVLVPYFFDGAQLEGKTFSTAYTNTISTGTKILYNLGLDKTSGTMKAKFNTWAINTTRYILADEGMASQILHMYIGTDTKCMLQ